jgi:catechol 2,3-dioxygenase-like lactoylglutathione lyase family enzyme
VIDHLEVRTRDIPANVRFYSDLLTPLGYELKVDGPAKAFGDEAGLDFFLVEGDPAKDLHFAFAAGSRAMVDRIYETGRKAGHKLDRAPALAPHVHPNYYAGYLRDPDDRLGEFVCQRAE